MKKLLTLLIEIIMWIAIVFWVLFQTTNENLTRADHIIFFVIDVVIFIIMVAYYLTKIEKK